MRRTKSQVVAMEEHVTKLVGALRAIGEPTHLDLANRLRGCQEQRAERRAGLRDRIDRPCRSIACPHCRRSRGKTWREKASDLMANADHASTSHATIMLARAGNLPAVRPVIQQMRNAIRALRDRRGRRDRRWRNVSLVGIVEIDLLEPGDIRFLATKRRALITELPYVEPSHDLVCVPHLHAVVSHPGLDRQAVEEELSRLWPGVGRVKVEPLHDGPVEEEAGGIIGYAAKHSMQNDFKDFAKLPVPFNLAAEYWAWLHGLKSGIQPLRFKMRSMKPSQIVTDLQDVDQDSDDLDQLQDLEPLPMVFGWAW